MPTLNEILEQPHQYLGHAVSITGEATLTLTPQAIKSIASISSTLIQSTITISPTDNSQNGGIRIFLDDTRDTLPPSQHHDYYVNRQLDAICATLPELHTFFRQIDADSESASKQQFQFQLGQLSLSGTLAHIADDPSAFTLIDLENATFTKDNLAIHFQRSGMYTPAVLLPDINFLQPFAVRRNLDMYLGQRIAVQGRLKRLNEFALTTHDANVTYVVPKSVGTPFGDARETAYFDSLSQFIHLDAPALEAEVATYIPTRRGQIPYDEDCWIIGTLDDPHLDHYFATLQDIELAIIQNGGRLYQWDFRARDRA